VADPAKRKRTKTKIAVKEEPDAVKQDDVELLDPQQAYLLTSSSRFQHSSNRFMQGKGKPTMAHNGKENSNMLQLD
jgi:hypothetical protein